MDPLARGAFKLEAFIARLKGRVEDHSRLRDSEEDSSRTLPVFFFFFLSSFLFPARRHIDTFDFFTYLLLLIIANRHGRWRFIEAASFLITTENRNATYGTSGGYERYIYIEFNARFSSAQFHRRPTTVLKGVLNRRAVKESHRDATYKGIPPTLSPSFFFSFSHQRSAHRSIPFEHFFLVRFIAPLLRAHYWFFFSRVIYILVSLHQ